MHDMLQLTTYMFIDTSTLIQINITTQPVFALCFAQNTQVGERQRFVTGWVLWAT